MIRNARMENQKVRSEKKFQKSNLGIVTTLEPNKYKEEAATSKKFPIRYAVINAGWG